MTSFRISPKGPFSLHASIRFLEGFAPAAHDVAQHPNHLHLVFPVEGAWENTVGVCIRQTSKAAVGEIFGDGGRTLVRRQVARILSLDVDGSGFPGVGKRDHVVRALQSSYAGLRPVLFWSPYEAAAWAIIGHRIRITQAARIKQRMAQEFGKEVIIHGERLHAFPSPQCLASMVSFPGLFARKIEYLHGVAEAAVQGRLDAARLRQLAREDALEELKRLPGIGDFSAELILVRGAGEPDHFSRSERRLHRAMADAYDFQAVPSIERLADIAEKWRPYRSWVSVLFRAELEDRTHAIAGSTRN
ncbi:MAG: DNA-3-methyladenine glycosylase family protein [Actinomycetota bacterium]